MDNARAQLTKEEEKQATQAGINMAWYRINRMKDQYGEAPLSSLVRPWVTQTMTVVLSRWEADIQTDLQFEDYFDVVAKRVAKLHMRRALILMRESNQWLSDYPEVKEG